MLEILRNAFRFLQNANYKIPVIIFVELLSKSEIGSSYFKFGFILGSLSARCYKKHVVWEKCRVIRVCKLNKNIIYKFVKNIERYLLVFVCADGSHSCSTDVKNIVELVAILHSYPGHPDRFGSDSVGSVRIKDHGSQCTFSRLPIEDLKNLEKY